MSKTVEYDKIISKPLKPGKVGYDFGGWYKDALFNGTKFRLNSTRIKSNMTLYAKWFNFGTISYGGKVWMDRNLGATKVASSVYNGGNKRIPNISVCGNYYQWGRGNDGHEKYESSTTTSPIAWNANSPKFIESRITWIKGSHPEKDYNIMNNPCPDGFRIPTKGEFKQLKNYMDNNGGASRQKLYDQLKIVECGRRSWDGNYFTGRGFYWSANSFVSGSYAYKLVFTSKEVRDPLRTSESYSTGYPIRCLKK